MADTDDAPTMTKDGRPFVLAWVEKGTLDKLQSGEMVFSEASDARGAGDGPWREDTEKCNDDPNTVSICTTIHF